MAYHIVLRLWTLYIINDTLIKYHQMIFRTVALSWGCIKINSDKLRCPKNTNINNIIFVDAALCQEHFIFFSCFVHWKLSIVVIKKACDVILWGVKFCFYILILQTNMNSYSLMKHGMNVYLLCNFLKTK